MFQGHSKPWSEKKKTCWDFCFNHHQLITHHSKSCWLFAGFIVISHGNPRGEQFYEYRLQMWNRPHGMRRVNPTHRDENTFLPGHHGFSVENGEKNWKVLLGINALYPSILLLLPEWRLGRLAAASMDAVLDLGSYWRYTLFFTLNHDLWKEGKKNHHEGEMSIFHPKIEVGTDF